MKIIDKQSGRVLNARQVNGISTSVWKNSIDAVEEFLKMTTMFDTKGRCKVTRLPIDTAKCESWQDCIQVIISDEWNHKYEFHVKTRNCQSEKYAQFDISGWNTAQIDKITEFLNLRLYNLLKKMCNDAGLTDKERSEALAQYNKLCKVLRDNITIELIPFIHGYWTDKSKPFLTSDEINRSLRKVTKECDDLADRIVDGTKKACERIVAKRPKSEMI